MIRQSNEQDIASIMEVWLTSNVETHSFVPESFWKEHYQEVKEAIGNGVLVYEEGGEIKGFLGIYEGYIAGLFVRKDQRSKGIGTKLMAYAKGENARLTLDVFVQNETAVTFYQREGFQVVEKQESMIMGLEEYHMEWIK